MMTHLQVTPEQAAQTVIETITAGRQLLDPIEIQPNYTESNKTLSDDSLASIKRMDYVWTELIRMFGTKFTKPQGYMYISDDADPNLPDSYSKNFVHWCSKLDKLTDNQLQDGIKELSRRVAESARFNEESWPPSSPEAFYGICTIKKQSTAKIDNSYKLTNLEQRIINKKISAKLLTLVQGESTRSSAFNDGYYSRVKKMDIITNPYDFDAEEFSEWEKGYSHAMKLGYEI